MTATTVPSGLLIRDPDPGRKPVRIPLLGVEVNARIEGPLGRTTVIQRYENQEEVPVEAVYVFPLPENATVSGFAVVIDDHRLVGKVKPRDEAFARYDDAMAEGHGAFLLDEERPNIFTASVGNLLPGQKVEVEVSYVSELTREGDAIRLAIPSTISPRYVPKSRQDFDGMTDGTRVNPPHTTGAVPYVLDLSVDVDLLSPISEIESPSHRIRTKLDGSRARVTLAEDDRDMDRDFVLLIKAKEATQPLSGLFTGFENERFALASFRPEFEITRRPVEAIFVVDCSGSMGGASIGEARRTLDLCLHSLTPGDYFNIVRFGSRHESFNRKSLPYDDESLRKARKYVTRMDANLGGTEILAPLKTVLGGEVSDEIPRRVVVITDGQVSNEDEVIKLVRKHQKTTSVFAFGIGYGASEHLVRGMARAGLGEAEFVYPGERIEDKVMRHFRRLTAPRAHDVALEWRGLEVEEVSPSGITSVYAGDVITVMARITGGSEGEVILRGKTEDRPFALTAILSPPSSEAEQDAIVPTLWARRMIRDMEEGEETDGGGSRQRSRRAQTEAKRRRSREDRIVDLATRYNLMSTATSFVVIEERAQEDRAKERAELREIPVRLTRGWGGVQATQLISMGLAAPAAKMDGVDRLMRTRLDGDEPRAAGPESLSMRQGLRSVSIQPLMDDRQEEAPSDPDLPLLLTQTASGAWELTSALAERCGISLEKLSSLAAECQLENRERILATLLVLSLFRARDDLSAAWETVIEKAEGWLAPFIAGPAPGGRDSWTEWATQLLPPDVPRA